jgi:hypothetical protein
MYTINKYADKGGISHFFLGVTSKVCVFFFWSWKETRNTTK